MALKLIVGVVAALLCAFELYIEVEPRAPITRRVLFVVDRSGSMQGDHFTRAIAGFKSCAEVPVDDLEIGVIAFAVGFERWPGKPDAERGTPPGWAALPSETAVAEAESWLTQFGAGGDTLIIPALSAALSEPRDELSIILVTDGLFGRERIEDILGLISAKQEERKARGLGRAVLACYGLGPNQMPLCRIGEIGRGGYIREFSSSGESGG